MKKLLNKIKCFFINDCEFKLGCKYYTAGCKNSYDICGVRREKLKIKKEIKKNGGYCTCQIKTDSSKCPCSAYRLSRKCVCGLFDDTD